MLWNEQFAVTELANRRERLTEEAERRRVASAIATRWQPQAPRTRQSLTWPRLRLVHRVLGH